MGSASQSPLGVAVVGAGFAASSHLDALSRVRGAEPVGIAASSPERGAAAAQRYGLPRSYSDLEALLSDPAVDVVDNCTPNHLHEKVTKAALAAGRHVLSEKPLAIDSAQADRLVKTAAGSGRVAAVCFNYRHFPLVQQARAMLAQGKDGPVHFAHGSYLQDWLLFEDDWNWRLETEKAGPTRAMADIGSHWVDTVQHVMGSRIVEVMADLRTLHRQRLRPASRVETFSRSEGDRERVAVDTDDFGSVLVGFESGARGAFSVSQVAPGRKNRLWFQIDAARASFVWDQEEPNALWVGRRDDANRDLVRDPSLLAPQAAALARFPGGHQEGWPDALRNLMEDVVAAIEASARSEPYARTVATFEDAAYVTRVVEAIERSHRTRSWVRVADELVREGAP